MKYCTNCGEQLTDEQSFCTECGEKQGDSRIVNQPVRQTEPAQYSEPPKAPREPMTRKTKIGMAVAAVIVIGLISAHFIVTSMIDPMKQVQAMDRAITDKNADAFFENVSVDKEALLHKEEFLSYIESSDWEYVRSQMINAIENDAQKTAFDHKITGAYGDQLFVMKKVAVVPKLYHTYEIKTIPNQITVATNYSPSNFSIDDLAVDVEKGKENGTVVKAYPGVYELAGKASSDYGDLAATETLEVTSVGGAKEEMAAEFPVETYNFQTDHSDAVLFINGKSTKQKLSSLDSIGPFPEGETVTFFAEWKDKEGKTHQTRTFDNAQIASGSVDLTFESEEEDIVTAAAPEGEEDFFVKEEVGNFVLAFRDAYERALNTIDYQVISSYLRSGSKAEDDLKEYIGDLKDEGFSYNFTENTILSAKPYKGNSYLVTTNEKFIFTNHEGDQTHYDRYKDYVVEVSGDEFQISRIDINETDRDDL
ncbi:zinc-ribbon domain-containing protein [Halobacillus sp. BBL2006]|uniref:TcaA NTF2-like domain-containing protein n=1 Tax=Halobacillus sp. BBL2006 TaxID=1543706 RepID=UPI000541FFB5|nr:zinc-ribbon domain-containing protein [Halobacillus sp. BBL2006]KHE73011.1 hypothetical protein LD39_01555 [Halobacillus sp. BBL2006]